MYRKILSLKRHDKIMTDNQTWTNIPNKQGNGNTPGQLRLIQTFVKVLQEKTIVCALFSPTNYISIERL